MIRVFPAAMLAVGALMLVPASSLAADVAVLGNNSTDKVLTAAGHNVTLVTDAEVATPGFLDGFDVFFFTRGGGSSNATLSGGGGAARAFTRRAVLLNGDFADAVTGDAEVRDCSQQRRVGGRAGHGYVGEFVGAFAGLTANDEQPALEPRVGSAGPSQFTGIGTIAATQPAPATRCSTASRCRATRPTWSCGTITGVAAPKVLARYTENDNPAICLRPPAHRGAGRQLDRQAAHRVAGDRRWSPMRSWRRRGSWTTSTRSSTRVRFGSVRDFTRRRRRSAGLRAPDGAAQRRLRRRRQRRSPRSAICSSTASSGRPSTGHGYVGEFVGAFAGLTSNASNFRPLDLVAGLGGAVQITGNGSTIAATANGAGHPVLDGVALPRDRGQRGARHDHHAASPRPRCSPATRTTTTRP